MTHLVMVIEELRGRQVGFRARCDGALETTTASGELIFHLFAALAQFERRLIQERTRAGLAAARARGRTGGRTPRRAEEPRVRMAYTMYQAQQLSVTEIWATLQLSQATFYRYVALGKRAAEASGMA
jgi:DNA invertase Pin-like site-specific DNA recombinase